MRCFFQRNEAKFQLRWIDINILIDSINIQMVTHIYQLKFDLKPI